MKVVVLLALALAVSAKNPGVTGSVDQTTLTNALNLAAGIGIQIAPNNYGNYTTNLKYSIFDLHIIITDITLKSVSYDSASTGIQVQSPNFFTVTVSGINANGQANYQTKMGLVDLTGVAIVEASNINAVVNVTVTATSGGMPQLAVNSAIVSVGGVTVSSSLPSALNNFINSEISKQISSLQSTISGLIDQNIPKLNTLLAGLSPVVAIPNTQLEINLGLSADPMVVNDNYIAGGLDGTLFNKLIGEPATEAAPGLPYRSPLSEGFQGQVSDYAITQALVNLAALYTYTLTSMPPGVPFDLDTDTLSILIPALSTVYGSAQPMNLKFYYDTTLPAPQFTTQNGVATVSGTVSMDLLVNANNAGFSKAVTLQVAFSLSGTAGLSGTTVSANISSYTIDNVNPINSQVGQLNGPSIATGLEQFIGTFISLVNKAIASNSVTFPTIPYGVTISADDVQAQSGYVAAGVNVA